MPNYVENRIRICGEDAEEILHSLLNKEQFDFNLIEPMPKEIENTEEGSSTYPCIMAYLSDGFKIPFEQIEKEKIEKYIVSQNTFSNPQRDYETGKRLKCSVKTGEQLVKNIDKYGYATWYGWSYEYWGTKWNASETTTNFDKPGEAYVEFTTAWASPEPVIEALSRQYPDILIKVQFFDEDESHCGEYHYQNGLSVYEDIPKDYNAGIEFYCKHYLGGTPEENGYIIDEDGEWVPEDDEY